MCLCGRLEGLEAHAGALRCPAQQVQTTVTTTPTKGKSRRPPTLTATAPQQTLSAVKTASTLLLAPTAATTALRRVALSAMPPKTTLQQEPEEHFCFAGLGYVGRAVGTPTGRETPTRVCTETRITFFITIDLPLCTTHYFAK